MGTARFIVGDTRDVTATIEDGSVDLVMTSPPFLALRSYLPADHPDKWREIGSEATPAEFIDMLLALTAEWGRVLAPHGSICVELGDTYSGSGGAGGDYQENGLRAGQQKFDGAAARGRNWAESDTNKKRHNPPAGWPMAKSKTLTPELYRIALAYGINPLTGTESPAGRWRVRNVVTWCRPNPPVGALGDKYRPATSDLVIACKASDRWFDLDAVRTKDGPGGNTTTRKSLNRGEPGYHTGEDDVPRVLDNPAGAPPLDYWVIPPGGYPGSHYAVYPPELCRIPIDSMCPRHVCTTCGQPRRRITERESTGQNTRTSLGMADDPRQVGAVVSTLVPEVARVTTLGWTDCGHNTWRPGTVLDPFAGSGTTLMVATGMGRDAIGIDIDERNAHLAHERVGMFLNVEHHSP